MNSLLSPRKKQKEMETATAAAASAAAATAGEGDGGGDGSLPFDATVEILARLPVKSLMRFRCVCKPWCSLTYDPIFVKKHHRIAASTTSTLFSSVCPPTFFDLGDGEITECTPPPLSQDLLRWHMISNTIDGLICGFLADSVFLNNLSTGEVAWLPSPTKANKPQIGLGFDPSSGTYKLLRVSTAEDSPGGSVCEALTVSPNQEWRCLARLPVSSFSIRELLYCNGFIHWIDRSHTTLGTPIDVIAFDCKDETFSTLPVPESAHFMDADLVSFEGRLCFAGMHNSCLTIMMLEDYQRPRWTTLYLISYAFLLDEYSGTDLHIIGIKDGKVLLRERVGWRAKPERKFTIYSYDLHSKVWSKMAYGQNAFRLYLHTGTLISPRRLLNQHGE